MRRGCFISGASKSLYPGLGESSCDIILGEKPAAAIRDPRPTPPSTPLESWLGWWWWWWATVDGVRHDDLCGPGAKQSGSPRDGDIGSVLILMLLYIGGVDRPLDKSDVVRDDVTNDDVELKCKDKSGE